MNYFLALGSNISPRIYHIDLTLIGLQKIGKILSLSDLYESEPYGVEQQPAFLNMVCKFSVNLSPFRLLRKLKEIEVAAGRKRSYRWGPREIDIDIIEWDGAPVITSVLIIPHPGMNLRRFALIPFRQVAPEFRSRSNKTLTELINHCPDKGLVTLYKSRAMHDVINA
jgi:2-amino-4-hydroxy-6-hydroxymethyldihydropteridine diphosphokinase